MESNGDITKKGDGWVHLKMSVIDPQDCIFNREKQPNTHWFLEVLALTLFSGEQKKQIDLDHHFTFSLVYYVRPTCEGETHLLHLGNFTSKAFRGF